MTALVGADAVELQGAAAQLRNAAAELDGHAGALTSNLRSVAWIGGVSSHFLGRWNGTYRPRMGSTADYLRDAADQLDRNAADQLAVSTASPAPGTIGALLGGAAAVGGQGPVLDDSIWDGVGDVLGEFGAFLTGDVANLWDGGDDGFPLGQLGAALVRVIRTRAFLVGGMVDELFPVFNTGRLGVALTGALEHIPGLAGVGRWLGTPAATTAFRYAGVVGAGASTLIGLHDLYRQGNPVDAFHRDGAGYVADVAGTAFSASTTLFLVSPHPITGALVIGTGLVWAGAEVVDHWDDITAWASDVWDAGTGVVGDAWDAGTDFLGGAWDAGTGFVGDAWDAGTDFIGGIGDGATDVIGGIFG